MAPLGSLLGRRLAVAALVSAGPVGWASHLLISYALVPESCARGTVVVLHLVTIVTTLVVALALVVTLGVTGHHRRGRPLRALVAAQQVEPGRSPLAGFLPRLGLMLAAYFGVLVMVAGLVAVVVDPCA